MSKTFACKDIGLECDFEANAESEEELMQKIAEHAKEAHNMEQIDEATMAKVEAAIKDESVPEPMNAPEEASEEEQADEEESASQEPAA